MRRIKIITLTILFTVSAFLISLPQARAQGQDIEIHGQVTDERGGVIVGARVTLISPTGAQKTVLTDQEGSYRFKGLVTEAYTLTVMADGFGLYENNDLKISSGQNNVLDIQLKVVLPEEQVAVSTDNPVSTESEGNADSLVLRGETLDVLPDDRDDLANALQALAGPSAGPNGGEIFVDGFSGARLPTKASIREVRVNQNPFSAEFDRIGYGRIEILTKPGTNEFGGEAFFSFNDESLNARNPYALTRAPYQVRSLDLSFSGPIVRKRASFFFDLEYRGIDDNAYINALVLDPSLNIVPFIQSALAPRRSQERQPRVDLQINKNHTLVAVFEFNPSKSRNTGIGGFTLPSRAFDTSSYERQFRLTETAVLNPRAVTETRLQYRYDRAEQSGDNSVPALNVLDAFNGGGDQSGPSLSVRNLLALYNNTTLTRGQHVLRIGGRLRRVTVKDESRSNFGGTFTFAGGNAVELDTNNQAVRDASGNVRFEQISSIERYRRTLLFTRSGAPARPPGVNDQDLGVGPTQFSISGGNPQIAIAQTDVSGFIQDQWNARSNLSVNLGLRYERQTNIQSNLNFAPRVAFAWSPKGSNTGPSKTVIRGGFGIFYDRILENLTLQAERFDGNNQRQYVISDPSVLATYPNVPSIDTLSGFALPQTLRRKAGDLRTPYLMQSAVSYERQLPLKSTISVTYLNTRSLHLLRSRNINAPLPGTFIEGVSNSGVRPFGNTGNIFEFESSGIFKQNQLILTLDNRFNKKFFLHATYALSNARSDTEGVNNFPANTYDLSGEYSRSSIDTRHRFTIEGTLNGPWGLRLAPFFIVSSGRPFNIIIGRDINGDTLFTERPAFATNVTAAADLVETQWGRFDLNPSAGAKLIPRNYGEGPMFAAMNLRVSKTISLSEIGSLFGMSSPASKADAESPYKLTISIQAQNLFNRTNNGLPVGNLSSPFFGESTATLGGYGEQNRSSAGNRRITGQIRIEF
ncbi:MAG TPA: carboxypeptidase regulatory-like domain-containing protein [Pyrinomonadaceae bacterium]|nr:carboxypeptidase regulatory-like domain-containing protein [Pyrinomonadaceae bacterium]